VPGTDEWRARGASGEALSVPPRRSRPRRAPNDHGARRVVERPRCDPLRRRRAQNEV